ncbi:hypothetical protein SAMN02745119_00870 [Trichlorobacter thiogenes]|uniref:Uncharacterized protein n=1 Tax=Trichlorobacter thiogenes TaxID=115783 RepID=A0A1T4LBB1_9BACT|nr:hypothetical protein [Trichlorobacter thiogenes]SJZ52102.1 hypothetical protein SAMN02745119_00870 [Trichlorobacter thiogenes]
MPEHLIRNGELWLNPDEKVIKIVENGRDDHIGLITTRASGHIYASMLIHENAMGYRYDVPRWEFSGNERTIFESIDDAEAVIRTNLIFIEGMNSKKT